MKENVSKTEEQAETGFLYQGNQIPKILRGVYLIFISWAVFYFISYIIPDLLEWLK